MQFIQKWLHNLIKKIQNKYECQNKRTMHNRNCNFENQEIKKNLNLAYGAFNIKRSERDRSRIKGMIVLSKKKTQGKFT